FISVASKLLLIKSKTLLPSLELTEEEEEDIKDLELRLQIYRQYCAKGASASGGKTAGQNINELWARGNIEYGRKLLQGFSNQGVFYPPQMITSYDLQASMRELFTNLADLIEPKARIKIKVVTLQEKMAELKDRLSRAISHDFKTLSANRPKQEIIVLFLAVLHLFAHKALDLEQEEGFGNIKISRKQAL
ncbi:MAG: segregation/condensation protein A, partial [bacterium]|nr:segregation/condensation protein A [bacterium]